jgi:putative ABC transport system permease protein
MIIFLLECAIFPLRLRARGLLSAGSRVISARLDLLALVLRQGMTLTALGIAIGLGTAMIASQAMVSLLFGISWLDPLTYSGVVIVLAGVSIVACWVPARRASRVDPSITLRAE